MILQRVFAKARLVGSEEKFVAISGPIHRKTTPNCFQLFSLLKDGHETTLKSHRHQRPRKVEEDPKSFIFESTNFNLLVKIFSLVPDADRDNFVHALLHYVRNPMGVFDYRGEAFPSFAGKTSALGLLAEFCVRTGHLHQLLSASTEAKAPTYGLAMMVRELEDMIALNFNLFSREELLERCMVTAHP
jgi:hypothetical protein